MEKTLLKIMNYLVELAKTHKFVKDSKWSDPDAILIETSLTYPFVFFSMSPGTIEQSTITIKVNMLIMDLLKNDDSNLNYILSDTFEIGHDIISKIDYEQLYYINQSSYEPLKSKRQNDYIAGMSFDFDLKIEKEFNSCNWE